MILNDVRHRKREQGRMSETVSLGLMGSHLVRELEKLRTLNFDDLEAGSIKLKEAEISIPFGAPAQSDAALPVAIGSEVPLTPEEVLARLKGIKAQAFVKIEQLINAPGGAVDSLVLRIKFRGTPEA